MTSSKQSSLLKEKLSMTLFPKIQFKEMRSKLRNRGSHGDRNIPKIAIIPPTPGSPEETGTSFFNYSLQDALPKSLEISKSPFRRNSEPWKIPGKAQNSRKRRPRNERSMSLPEGEERAKDLLQVPCTPRRRKKIRRGSSDDQINMKWITDNARIDRQVMSFAKPLPFTGKLQRSAPIHEEKSVEESTAMSCPESLGHHLLPTPVANKNHTFENSHASEIIPLIMDRPGTPVRKEGTYLNPLVTEIEEINGLFSREEPDMVMEDSSIKDAHCFIRNDECIFHLENDTELHRTPTDELDEENVGDSEDLPYGHSPDEYGEAELTPPSDMVCEEDIKIKCVPSRMTCDEKEEPEKPKGVIDGGFLGKMPYTSNLKYGRNLFQRLTNDLVETISSRNERFNSDVTSCKNCRMESEPGLSLSRRASDIVQQIQDYRFNGFEEETPAPSKQQERSPPSPSTRSESKKPIGLFCLDNLLEALNRTT